MQLSIILLLFYQRKQKMQNNSFIIALSKVILIICLFSSTVFSLDCQMTAVISFAECMLKCRQIYGNDSQTQRQYFNRSTSTCEPKVPCKDTPHRVYQNRCLEQFEDLRIGDVTVNPLEDYSEVRYIVLYGNEFQTNEDKMCYPGFTSSRSRRQVSPQIYEEYRCDVLIGSDPVNYPQSHGEYYFHRTSVTSQIKLVEENCPTETWVTLLFLVLLVVEVYFCGAMCHYQVRKCRLYREMQSIEQDE